MPSNRRMQCTPLASPRLTDGPAFSSWLSQRLRDPWRHRQIRKRAPLYAACVHPRHAFSTPCVLILYRLPLYSIPPLPSHSASPSTPVMLSIGSSSSSASSTLVLLRESCSRSHLPRTGATGERKIGGLPGRRLVTVF